MHRAPQCAAQSLSLALLIACLFCPKPAYAGESGYTPQPYTSTSNTPAELAKKKTALKQLRAQWDGDDFSAKQIQGILSGFKIKNPKTITQHFKADGTWHKPLPKGKKFSSADYKLNKAYFADLLALAYLDEFEGADQRKTIYRSLAWYFGNGHAAPPQYHETFNYHAPQATVGGLMTIVGLLMFDEIHTDRQNDRTVQAVYQQMRAYGRQFINAAPQIRGPNWSFRLDNCLRYVLFTNEPQVMDEYDYHWKKSLSFNRWEAESTGVHPDWSIMHHGQMNYWGMYGIGWTARVLEYGQLFANKPWAYETPQLDFIANCMIEGTRWVLYRGNCEYTSAPKRGTFLLARTDNVAESFKELVEQLIRLGGNQLTRKTDLLQLNQELILPPWSMNNKTDTRKEITGHRYFWNTEYQVHRRPEFAIYARRNSQRARPPGDSSQKPGTLHLNYGTGYTPIMRRGDELRFSRLAWDFEKVPGTTVEQGCTVAAGKAASTKRGLNLFSGGVSDDLYGCGAFDLQMVQFKTDSKKKYEFINGAGALKGTFFFDDGMIALGQNIRRIAPGKGKILTTINNVIRKGKVIYSVDGQAQKTIKPGSSFDESLKPNQTAWVWHDSIGYVILGKADLALSCGQQRFHQRLKTDKDFQKAITRELGADAWKKGSFDMFRLWIDHGVNPRKDAYTYAVLPGCSVEQLKAHADQLAQAVGQNAGGVMAVAKDGVHYAIFAKRGTARFTDGKTLSSPIPLIVMAHQSKDKRFTFHASNPEHRGLREPYVPGNGPTIGRLVEKPIAVASQGFAEIKSVTFTLPTERGGEGASVRGQTP